ncbi:MAG: hypothetical protein IPN33_06550 [Saprospiraceae bacterium]|nr:hypothetical protein [Saprospiraceae bacterium]
MRTKPLGRTIDIFVQTLLLAPTLFSAIYALLFRPEYGVTFFFGLFIIGAWQLLSSFCWGFIANFTMQRRYFLAAASYVAVLIGMAYASTYLRINYNDSQISVALYIALIAGIPTVASLWYWLQTYRLWAHYTPKSFWDLV